MANNVIPIGSMTIPAGTTPLGPMPTGVGHNGFNLHLDVANCVDPVTFEMWYADDGVNFVKLSTEGPLTAASLVNRDGTPALVKSIDWQPNIGKFGTQLNLTTAISQVKVIIINTTAFVTNGGTLTVV